MIDLFSRGDVDGGFGAAFTGTAGPGVIPFPAQTADAIPNLDQALSSIAFEYPDRGSQKGLGNQFLGAAGFSS